MSLMMVKLEGIKRMIDLKIIRMLQLFVLVMYGMLMFSIPDAPGLKFFSILYLATACATADEGLYNEYARGFARGFGLAAGYFGAIMLLVGTLAWDWEVVKYGMIIGGNLVFVALDRLADEEYQESARKISVLTVVFLFASITFMAYVLNDFAIHLVNF